MPTHLRLSLLLAANLWWLTTNFAQYNQAETFTIQDGLAHTECSTLFVDSHGHLWIIHHLGWISTFDGRKFISYSPEELGVHWPGGSFRENSDGVWLIKGTHVSHKTKSGWKSWTLPTYVFGTIVDKSSDEIVLHDTLHQLYTLSKDRKAWVKNSSLPEVEKPVENLIIPSRNKNEFLLLQYIPNLKTDALKKAFITSSLVNPVWKEVPVAGVLNSTWAYHEVRGDLIKYLNFTLPYTDRDVVDEQVCSDGKRLFYMQTRRTPSNSKYDLHFYEIFSDTQYRHIASVKIQHKEANMTMDASGQIWVTSHNGLTHVNPAVLECYDDLPNMLSSLHTINEDDRGNIWFGGYSTGACFFDGKKIQTAPQISENYEGFLPGHYHDENGKMAFWVSPNGLVVYENGIWTDAFQQTGKFPPILGFCFLTLSNGKIAAGLSGFGMGITSMPLTAKSKWKIIDDRKGMHLQNVLTLSEDKAGRLWAGRYNQGLALYDFARDTAHSWLVPKNISFGVMSSTVDATGRLWLGCSDGLRYFDKPHEIELFDSVPLPVSNLVSMDEAGYSQVQFLTTYNDYLVFGNNAGFGFLDLKSFDQEKSNPRIHFVETSETGLSSEQNAVFKDSKGYLWIGQDRGAIRIDMNQYFFDTTMVKLTIEKLVTRGMRRDSIIMITELNRDINLPYLHRNITAFIGLESNPSLLNNVSIQYSLVNKNSSDTLWSPTTKNFTIRIDILPPGKNTLILRALKNNQVADIKSYVLFVPPKLMERPLFWFTFFGILSAFGFLITRNIYKQRLQLRLTQINLAEQQREKNQFQISAIANALNPHFIKNTLAWMQSRFRKDEQVVDVIDRLAFNIGSVFSHSRKGEAFHTLEEEMKVLDNFLSIQLAIYGPFLHITLPNEESWKKWKDVLVPLLQIQIHVENAIEHGLRNKPKGEKRLVIDIHEHDDQHIMVIVEDNGIGRAAAKERGSRGTRQGTMMLDRVYELYNQHNQNNFKTTFEDLYDDEGGASGTRILITIPKHYKLELA